MWPRFSIKEFKKSQQRRQRECQNKRKSQKSRFTMWNQTTRKFSSSFKTWMALWNSTPTEYANTWNSEERRKLISLQVSSPFGVVCATDNLKVWLSPSVKLRQNPCCSPTTCVPGCEYAPWLARYKAIVDLPIRLNRPSKRISGNSLRPLEAPNKDFGEKVKLRRYCKLVGLLPKKSFQI